MVNDRTSRSLPPPNRHECRGDLLQPSLRRQQIELRRRIPRILHLDSNPKLRQIIPSLGTQRQDPGPSAQDKQIRLRPHQIQSAPNQALRFPLSFGILKFVVVCAASFFAFPYPGPPFECLAAYEHDACTSDARAVVQREAVFHARDNSCGRWWHSS